MHVPVRQIARHDKAARRDLPAPSCADGAGHFAVPPYHCRHYDAI
jgi:hypothetical protein